MAAWRQFKERVRNRSGSTGPYWSSKNRSQIPRSRLLWGGKCQKKPLSGKLRRGRSRMRGQSPYRGGERGDARKEK
jgi:hypothetical protein